MNIPLSFLESEKRDGFQISAMMKRAWAVEIQILSEIDRVCKKYDIPYFVDWGTLLGAVRHEGFIPWDDDMDISMRRKDFMRFLEVAGNELSQGYSLVGLYSSAKADRVFHAVTADPKRIGVSYGFPYWASVDIFTLDNLPVEPEEKEYQFHLANTLYQLSVHWNDEGYASFQEKCDLVKSLEKISGVSIPINDQTKYSLLRVADIVCASYTECETKEVSLVLQRAFMGDGKKFEIPLEWVERTIYLPFEYIEVPVPIGYQKLLCLEYGDDYMIPKHNKCGHEYPYYRKQYVKLKKSYEDRGLCFPEEYQENFEE